MGMSTLPPDRQPEELGADRLTVMSEKSACDKRRKIRYSWRNNALDTSH